MLEGEREDGLAEGKGIQETREVSEGNIQAVRQRLTNKRFNG